MKWYVKLLIVLLVIVFSPVILTFLIFGVAAYLIELPKNKKEYKNSAYYRDFGLPFMTYRFYSPEYRFYNGYKKRNLRLKYIRQESNGQEYFIFNDTLFVFPDFDGLNYDEEKGIWEADYDGDWKSFEEAYGEILSKLENTDEKLPIKLLVERRMFSNTDLSGVKFPECIFLTRNFDTAFENEDLRLLLKVPTTVPELYDMMLETPNLCGDFKIDENGNIAWNLYENIIISIGVDVSDCCISVEKQSGGKINTAITHWHPTVFEIYDEVCEIGTLKNVMVIKTHIFGAAVLYRGDEKYCPYTPNERALFSKYYYLKAD